MITESRKCSKETDLIIISSFTVNNKVCKCACDQTKTCDRRVANTQKDTGAQSKAWSGMKRKLKAKKDHAKAKCFNI